MNKTNSMENHIGKVLFFKEPEFNRFIGHCNTHVLPKLEVMKAEYNKLDMGDFTHESFSDMMKVGSRNVETAYFAALEEDSKVHKVASFAKHMVDYVKSTGPMVPLQNVLTQLKASIDEYNSRLGNTLSIEFKYFSYTGNRFVVYNDAVRRDLTKVIENQDQSDMYQSLIELKEAAQKFQDARERVWPDRPYVKLNNLYNVKYGSEVILLPLGGKWELNEDLVINMF